MPPVTGTIAAYIFTVDERLMAFLLLVDGLVALAATLLVMRERRWLDAVGLFLLFFVLLFILSALFVQVGLSRPFLVVEVVSLVR